MPLLRLFCGLLLALSAVPALAQDKRLDWRRLEVAATHRQCRSCDGVPLLRLGIVRGLALDWRRRDIRRRRRNRQLGERGGQPGSRRQCPLRRKQRRLSRRFPRRRRRRGLVENRRPDERSCRTRSEGDLIIRTEPSDHMRHPAPDR